VHELAITQNIVDIALGTAADRRIKTITIVIGELSGIVEDSVRFCFDVVAAETAAQGATLTVRTVSARIQCSGCASEYEPDSGEWLCPRCGNLGGQVMRGRECYIESIDVEDVEDMEE